MRHIITKFGGTSVSTRPNWDNIVSITKAHLQPDVTATTKATANLLGAQVVWLMDKVTDK